MAVFMLLAIASIAKLHGTSTVSGRLSGRIVIRNIYDRYRNDRNGYNNACKLLANRGYRNGLSTGASDAQRGPEIAARSVRISGLGRTTVGCGGSLRKQGPVLSKCSVMRLFRDTARATSVTLRLQQQTW